MFKQYELIALLAKIVEERDAYTAGHSARVARYASMLAEQMQLSIEEQNSVYQSGLLHDIGKISTPEAILLKPGVLSAEEMSIMQEHPRSSERIITQVTFLRPFAKAVLHHHERFDGQGYPDGLMGEAIPLQARILAVADAFDAMTTRRHYRKQLEIKEALDELLREAGKQFDPVVVENALVRFAALKIPEIPEAPIFPSLTERSKLAYIFKDSLTDVFNGRLLDTYLLAYEPQMQFRCCYHFSIKKMHAFNHKNGWKEGDEALILIASRLKKLFPEAHIFRLQGDEFALLHQTHHPVEVATIRAKLLCGLEELDVVMCHYDLAHEHFLSWDEISQKTKENTL